MEYRVRCDIKTKDLWKLDMSRIYHSMAGVVNIVFTFAMLLLIIRFYSGAGLLLRILLVVAFIWFPVVHPLAVFGRCAKQLENTPKDVELTFRDKCIHVSAAGKNEDIDWKKIRVILRKNMIIIMSGTTHGYMLTDRAMGDMKKDILDYLTTKSKI